MKVLTNLDLTLNQILNALAQVLASDPGSPVEGQFWYNSTTKTFKYRNDSVTLVLGTLDQIVAAAADVSLNSHKITNLATPSASTDAATRGYVDGLVNGLTWKDAVRAGSHGSSITIASPGAAIGGVTLSSGDRVLLRNQGTASQNGIYVWNGASTPMTRSADAATGALILQAACFVEEGTDADTAWVCTTDAPITIDSTALTFGQLSAGAAYTASSGVKLAGNDIELDAPVSVANGGTASANASDARTALGVAYGATGDIAAESSGASAAAGSVGKVADAGHVHAMPALQNLSAGATGDMSAEASSSTVAAGSTGKYSDAGHRHAMPYVPGKYAADVGDGSNTTYTITHSLGTKDVVVSVYRKDSPYDVVFCDVVITDTNTVTLTFAVAPTSAQFRVVVLG